MPKFLSFFVTTLLGTGATAAEQTIIIFGGAKKHKCSIIKNSLTKHLIKGKIQVDAKIVKS